MPRKEHRTEKRCPACKEIKVVSEFDLSDPKQQKQCFHYTNLQPLFATDNREKGAKILYKRRWAKDGWVDNVR